MVLPLHDVNPTKRVPIVTLLIIAVNIVVYLAVQPHGSTAQSDRFLYQHAAIACEVVHGHPLTEAQLVLQRCSVPEHAVVREPIGGSAAFEPAHAKNVYLAILVSMFLHASLLHLFGNMLFLWIFGNNVEDHLRPLAYGLLYVAAGIVAAAAFVVFNASSVSPLLGASGAIAGVMGAYLVWFPRARVLSIVVVIPLYLPASLVLGVWFVMQFFTNPNSGVAWVAHVAGFVFGALVAMLLSESHGPHSRHVPPPPPLPGSWPGGLRGLG